MRHESDRLLDRVGAVAGVASVVLLALFFTVLPSLPEPTASPAELARGATADESGLLLGAYVGTLLGVALIVFGACVAALVRRAEGPAGGWWIVALAGIASTSIDIVGDALLASFVRAV